MAPSGRRRRRRAPTTREPRRIQCTKLLDGSKIEEPPADFAAKSAIAGSGNSSKTNSVDFDGVDVASGGCSTPKGERFHIPPILTCPPAPKKRRVLSDCSPRRTPIGFFAPPDLDLVLLFALRKILV
ncbi:hypothetical protein U1Q18_012370 [Sarracenia purpurea var. burkii]